MVEKELTVDEMVKNVQDFFKGKKPSLTFGVHHKRLHDFVAIDRTIINTVPRFKQSGLSGDEWRFSTSVQFFFKNNLVHEESFGSMKYAVGALFHTMYSFLDHGIPDGVLDVEKITCDNPHCPNLWTKIMVMKKEFSEDGSFEGHPKLGGSYRKFCEEHSHRGCCDLEDADDNYVILEGIKNPST